ncbi:RNA-binding domain-containing protein [Candidatus Lokiarchaeum ossiferum]|uniref:RNA-binding domain-containing protein n=1 Tax=Candidatus Lokiarchaeum ossiferum TaxID=2951803 RepID=UPI00352EB5A2
MNLFERQIDQITLKDVSQFISQNPSETHRLDYKEYIDTSDHFKFEFLRDIISFANIHEKSLLIYGVSDNQKLVGLEIKDDFTPENLQIHLTNILQEHIRPFIIPYIRAHPIFLNKDRFILIVQINSPKGLIFGIRFKHENISYSKHEFYEFWIRSSANKKSLSFNQIQELSTNIKLERAVISERAFISDTEVIKDLIKSKIQEELITPELEYTIINELGENTNSTDVKEKNALDFLINQINQYERNINRKKNKNNNETNNEKAEQDKIKPHLWFIEAPIGMGKTTLINHLYIRLVDLYFQHSLVTPLMIDCNQITSGDWLGLLTQRYQHHSSFIESQNNRCSEKKGKMVILFDGMDEIKSQSILNDMKKKLHELFHNNVFILISSRTLQVNLDSQFRSFSKGKIQYPKEILLKSIGFKEQIDPMYHDVILQSFFKFDRIPGIFFSPFFIKILVKSWNIESSYSNGVFSLPLKLTSVSDMYYNSLIEHEISKDLESDTSIKDIINEGINFAIEFEYNDLEGYEPTKFKLLKKIGIVVEENNQPHFIHEYFKIDFLARAIVAGKNILSKKKIFQLALKENRDNVFPSTIEYAIELALEKGNIKDDQFDIYEHFYEDNSGFFTRIKNKVLLARNKLPSDFIKFLFDNIKKSYNLMKNAENGENDESREVNSTNLHFYVERLNTVQFSHHNILNFFQLYDINVELQDFIKKRLTNKSNIQDSSPTYRNNFIININEVNQIFSSIDPQKFTIEKYSKIPMDVFLIYLFSKISPYFTKTIILKILDLVYNRIEMYYKIAQKNEEEHLITEMNYLEEHPNFQNDINIFYYIVNGSARYCRKFIKLEEILYKIEEFPFIISRFLSHFVSFQDQIYFRSWRTQVLLKLLRLLILNDDYQDHKYILFITFDKCLYKNTHNPNGKIPVLDDLFKEREICTKVYSLIFKEIPIEFEKHNNSWSLNILLNLIKVQSFLSTILTIEEDGEILAFIYAKKYPDRVNKVIIPTSITEIFGRKISQYYEKHLNLYSEMFTKGYFYPNFNSLVQKMMQHPSYLKTTEFRPFPIYISLFFFENIPNLIDLLENNHSFKHQLLFSKRVKNLVFAVLLERYQNGNETSRRGLRTEYWRVIDGLFPEDDESRTYIHNFLKIIRDFPKEFENFIQELTKTENLLDTLCNCFREGNNFQILEKIFLTIIENELEKIIELTTHLKQICKMNELRNIFIDSDSSHFEINQKIKKILLATSSKTDILDIAHYIEKLDGNRSHDPGEFWFLEFHDLVSYSNFEKILLNFPTNQESCASSYNIERLIEFYIDFLKKFELSLHSLQKIIFKSPIHAWYFLNIPEFWETSNFQDLLLKILRKYPNLTLAKFPFNKIYFNKKFSMQPYFEIYFQTIHQNKSHYLKYLNQCGSWDIGKKLASVSFDLRQFIVNHEQFLPMLLEICAWRLNDLILIAPPIIFNDINRHKFYDILINSLPKVNLIQSNSNIAYIFEEIVNILEVYFPEKAYSYYIGETQYNQLDDLKELKDNVEDWHDFS